MHVYQPCMHHSSPWTPHCASPPSPGQESVQATASWFASMRHLAAPLSAKAAQYMQALPQAHRRLHLLFLVNDLLFAGWVGDRGLHLCTIPGRLSILVLIAAVCTACGAACGLICTSTQIRTNKHKYAQISTNMHKMCPPHISLSVFKQHAQCAPPYLCCCAIAPHKCMQQRIPQMHAKAHITNGYHIPRQHIQTPCRNTQEHCQAGHLP